jgi:D-psicose/D-tagatose/L-ribulose 3-epimerase
MKLGVNAFIWSAAFSEANFGLLPVIKAKGFDGIEVPLFDPAAFKAAEIRRAVQAEGLGVTVCSIIPRGLNLVSDDAALRAKTVTHLKDAIKRTAEVGATLIDGPLYCPVGDLPGRRRTADEWRWAVEGYQSLTDTLDAYGITLAIEPLNRFEAYFLNTVGDVAAICDQVGHPRVGIAFDTFHANIEEKSIPGACRAIARHLKHVQVSENDRGTPGSGHIAWRDLFGVLGEIGYDAWLTIESFGANLGDFSSAVCIWRDIEPTPDEIAYKGIEFLRRELER